MTCVSPDLKLLNLSVKFKSILVSQLNRLSSISFMLDSLLCVSMHVLTMLRIVSKMMIGAVRIIRNV